MITKSMKDFQKAITDHRKLIKDYERSIEPSSLLLEELEALMRKLLDDFFDKTVTDKPVRKARKKQEKTEIGNTNLN